MRDFLASFTLSQSSGNLSIFISLSSTQISISKWPVLKSSPSHSYLVLFFSFLVAFLTAHLKMEDLPVQLFPKYPDFSEDQSIVPDTFQIHQELKEDSLINEKEFY